MVKRKAFSIQINGSHELSFVEKGGWLQKGPEFPNDIDLDVNNGELVQQEKKAKKQSTINRNHIIFRVSINRKHTHTHFRGPMRKTSCCQ